MFGRVDDLIKMSCTDSSRWVRVAVTVASATALLSSVSIKVDVGRRAEEKRRHI